MDARLACHSLLLATILLTACSAAGPCRCDIREADCMVPPDLPVLAARYLLPPDYEKDSGPDESVWEHPLADTFPEEPGFATADAALDAARRWLATSFTNGVPAEAVHLHFDAGREDTRCVHWQQLHAGLRTGGHGSIRFRGTTPVEARMALFEFSPVARSERPLIDKHTALATCSRSVRSNGLTIEELLQERESSLLPEPRLQFVLSRRKARQPAGGGTLPLRFEPTWILDDKGLLGVHAHTGQAWYGRDSNPLAITPLPGTDATGSIPKDGPSLSLIRCRKLAPKPGLAPFEKSGRGYCFGDVHAAGRREDPPFATDAEAVSAVKQWIVGQFGPLPTDTDLVVNEIRHKGDGDDAPQAETLRIVLQQTWRGTPTDHVSVVEVFGCGHFHGHVCLAAMTPVPDSERPTVTAAMARNVVHWVWENRGLQAHVLEAIDKDMQPALIYMWSPMHDKDRTEDVWILAPTWVAIPGDEMMVDGHSGRYWRNC